MVVGDVKKAIICFHLSFWTMLLSNNFLENATEAENQFLFLLLANRKSSEVYKMKKDNFIKMYSCTVLSSACRQYEKVEEITAKSINSLLKELCTTCT